MKILFFGDIVGRIGRQALVKSLPGLKKELRPDLVLANAENLAHGKGVTVKSLREMIKAGVDVFTSGNHFWSKHEEAKKVIAEELPVIRPANYPKSYLGAGFTVLKVKTTKVLLINLSGRTFVKYKKGEISCPFIKLDEILSGKMKVKIKILDFHAEATSEKVALSHYADGRLSAILGTHTHVQTADETISRHGTAYISDVGMVGAKDSVIGIDKNVSINLFLSGKLQEKIKHEIPKTGPALINGVLLEINNKSGRAKSIKRIKRVVLIK